MMLAEYAAKVDEYALTRAQRLEKQRETDELETKEKKLKAELIALLRDNNTKTLGGLSMTVTLTQKEKAVARDWNAIHEYIVTNDAWDIMQKRLTETAIRLRWEEGVAIPGVEKFPVDDLSLSTRT